MFIPYVIDNQTHKMRDVLAGLLKEHEARCLDIATAYFNVGVYCTIIDAAAFWAVYPEVDEDFGMTSVDVKLNYLSPASSGMLIARGRRIKLGKTLGLGEAEVTDQDGRILAHGTSTLIVLPNLAFAHDGPLPPKFTETA